MIPAEPEAGGATLREVLTVWCFGAAEDHSFTADLSASGRPPTKRWEAQSLQVHLWLPGVHARPPHAEFLGDSDF